ncbi:MAG: metallophosphoesterase family protein [Anaerolineales bacterium]|jgi:diadenosine tetraphosphatase ApaH/serine/threonine PP2A family protein phosphatase
MRVLTISDIHANLTALEAVLEAAGDIDATWCLGDLVGYGPDPNECIERIQALPGLLCLIGNHDQAAMGEIPLARFNNDAGSVIAWTQDSLSEANLTFLHTLPSKVTLEEFTLAHGSPNQPIWEYILDPLSADRNFEAFNTDYCLVGHSHIPLMFHKPFVDSYTLLRPVTWNEPMALSPRMIMNPGSVGQPRDGDPRASFAILDTEAKTWELMRAEYDIKAVQLRILKAGLPERQALRLLAGW